jgi:hypothetical protein
MNIKLTFRSGTVKEFKHEGRPGGSYSKKIRYEGSFVVITDEYDRTWAYPVTDIALVETKPDRY